ncbi:MAG: hypothetical protein HY815_33145 [Candidatus Riflebacteria bacterium]|nr:hypothetical protein [Candidatus Riflebacteria bacterium]
MAQEHIGQIPGVLRETYEKEFLEGTGDSARLGGHKELLQEYAPGNLVYVAGHKVMVAGLNFRKIKPPSEETFGTLDEERYFVCPKCQFVSPGSGVRTCPRCCDTPELAGHLHLPADHFQGFVHEAITSAEEVRTRKSYQVQTYLMGDPIEWVEYSYPSLDFRLVRRQKILSVNTGFRAATRDRTVQPFRICLRRFRCR